MADENKTNPSRDNSPGVTKAGTSDKPSSYDQKMKTYLGGILGIVVVALVMSMFLTPTPKPKKTEAVQSIDQTIPTTKFSDQVQFEQQRLAAERMRQAMGQTSYGQSSQPVTDAEWERKEAVRALSSRTASFGLKEAHKNEQSSANAGQAPNIYQPLYQQQASPVNNYNQQQMLIQAQQTVMARQTQPAQITSGGMPGDSIVGRTVDDRFAGWRKGDELLLPTGSQIDAILDQDVNSDYVGPWRGHLAQDFYSVDNQFILLPKGTKIMGQSNHIANVNEPIQNRMGLTVEWAILPNGKRIDFSKNAPVDQEGIAAYSGDVNRHLLAQFLGVTAYALVSASGPRDQMNQYGVVNPTFKGQLADSYRGALQPLLMKYLSLVPTVTVRAGTPIKIVTQDDMYVRPWARVNTTVY